MARGRWRRVPCSSMGVGPMWMNDGVELHFFTSFNMLEFYWILLEKKAFLIVFGSQVGHPWRF